MKILIVPSWYADRRDELGTGGIFHYEQAKELSKNNTVAIYYMFDGNLEEDFYKQNERGILTYRSKFIMNQRVRNRVRIFQAFRRIIKEFKPDIIHTHVATEAGRYVALWSSLFKIPFIVTEHSTVEVTGVDSGLAYQYAKFVYKKSSGNFCVSENLQQKLKCIFPQYIFRVIYNGIIIPEKIEFRQQYAKVGKCNIGFVAALYDREIKGLQYLLPALKEVNAKESKCILHIVGGGEFQEYFQNMVKELQLDEQVVFYGMCSKEKVYEILAQLDFLVSSSLVESFGCSIAEALLMGKPVLATRCGGPESFVTNKVGILVDKGSVEALRNGIQEMMKKIEQYDAKEIEEYAKTKFDNTIVCAKYNSYYSQIVNEGKTINS